MIQNIIFDFDGVLVDSEILVIRAFCEYLKGLNIIITEKEFASYTGNKTIDVIEKLSHLYLCVFLLVPKCLWAGGNKGPRFRNGNQ